MTALGCGGPADLTTVDDLRLVAVVADPPEGAVGELAVVTAVVADPFGEGADVTLWQCGPPDLPCAVATGGLEGDVFRGTAAIGLPLWIVACRPGLCPTPSEERLRDPVGWLRTLPIDGVAAGTKTVPIGPGRENPLILTAPLPEVVGDPEDAVPLRFVAPGVETASPLATAGGFAQLSEAVPTSGDFTLDWRTPSEPGEARIWVVLDDGLGGTAVWRGTGVVR